MDGHLRGEPTGPSVTKPHNPAFSPAVNIQFFEPLLKCHAHKPLIRASACFWTPSKQSMSFLRLDPELAHGAFQTELNLSGQGWHRPPLPKTLSLGPGGLALPLPFLTQGPGAAQPLPGATAFHV